MTNEFTICGSSVDGACVFSGELERMQESIDLFRATIARIQALPAKWRGDYYTCLDGEQAYECANELETALIERQP